MNVAQDTTRPARPGRLQRLAGIRHAASIVGIALLMPAQPSAARPNLIETTIELPVLMHDSAQRTTAQRLAMRVVRPARSGRLPFLVLQHGRPADGNGRAALGLADYPANARYFAEHGFVVLIPTRIGYGVSHGPDMEYTGECANKQYATALAAAIEETREINRYAARQPYVDATRGLMVGESFGGLIAIAASATDLPGLLGAVNIAGGDGGDSLSHPDEPCRPDQLTTLFAGYGKANRLPTLWMYSVNDRLWGPRYPSQWFAAFSAAGGHGTFVTLPADKNNGHFIFTRNAPTWHPAFERFLSQIGLGST